jgi:hypothetical protein
MRWCRKERERNSCKLKDALTKALTTRSRVSVELETGLAFIDEIVSFANVGEQEIAVFRSNQRVDLRDIALVETQ